MSDINAQHIYQKLGALVTEWQQFLEQFGDWQTSTDPETSLTHPDGSVSVHKTLGYLEQQLSAHVAWYATSSQNISDASENALAAQQWAANPLNTPVPGSAGLYSARHYQHYSALAETAAAASQLAAFVSQTAASESQLASQASEMAAQASEMAAQASEMAAKASEMAAKASEVESKASEVESKASETRSQASEVAAKASEVAAQTSATAAQNSAVAASSSELAALQASSLATIRADASLISQNVAAASALAAEGSQVAAYTSEQSALASRNASSASAEAAKLSELAAAASSASAETSQGAALLSETAALESQTAAELAAIRSETASALALSSKSAAEIASISASNSASSAQNSQEAAALYEDSAAGSALSASDSATAAANAQASAAVSAASALGSRNLAASSEASASLSASQALESQQVVQALYIATEEAKNAAQSAALSASNSEAAASASAQAAATSAASMVGAEEVAVGAAEAASDSAVVASAAASTAQTLAAEVQTNTNTVLSARNEALLAADNAHLKASAAETSANSAANSASSALSSKSASSLSEQRAATSQSNAAFSEQQALAHELKAKQWAQHSANVGIPGEVAGTFSAKHWALKAQHYAETLSQSLVFRGAWDASEGTFPIPSTEVGVLDYYRVTVAGMLTGTQGALSVAIGDFLHWDSSLQEWFKVESGAAVISLNGRVGAVELSAQDVGLENVPNVDTTNAANITQGILPAARLSGTYLIDVQGALTGNASTASLAAAATKLATARQINGVLFDGTGDITVTAAPTAHTHAWAEVTGVPATATRWPAWAEVSDKPATFTPTSHTHAWAEVTGAPATATRWPAWAEVSDKPATFTPAVHSHPWAEVTGAPATATRWPAWDEVSSKPTTFAPAAHTHAWVDVTGAPATATRWPTWSEVTSKPATFTPAVHTHSMSDVTGLSGALESKAAIDHAHVLEDLTNVSLAATATGHLLRWNGTAWANATLTQAGIQPAGAYAAASHTHPWSDITGVPSATTSAEGVVQLNNTVTSTSTTQAATANAAKLANDNANTRALASLVLTAGNGLEGGGDLRDNRTLTLGTPGSITAASTNSVTATSHTHAIDRASTTVVGIVQLSTSTNSTSTMMAATASAVKAANDNANGRLPLTGGTLTGALNLRSAGNATLSLGRVDGTPTPSFIHFNTSGNENGYDSRITASGGNTSFGNGALTYQANGGHTFTGPVTMQQVQASSFIGGGGSLTGLNASNLSSGTIPDARISGSYTGMTNLTGSGNVDFAKFLGNASDTVSAPSYSWTGDTDTGIYRPTTDQVAITTGGVQRALFNSSGISGVGTGLTALNASNLTTGTVPVARLPSATTSAEGIVQLSTSTGSTSATLAATASAVKAANDNANGRLSLTGGTLTGGLNIRPAGNAVIEHGRVDGTASTPIIDFHSSGNNIDYDSRITASGGNTSSGNGTLQYIANGGHTFTGNVDVNTLKATGYMTIGANATPSSSANLKIDDSFTPNATRYGIYNVVNVTDGTLTAARTHYASYNDIRNDYLSNDAYGITQYGSWSRVTNGPSGGANAFLNTAIGVYGFMLNQAGGTGDLGRVASATGVYGGVQNSNTGIISNAYAFRGNINSSNATGDIVNAYGLHLGFSNTGNISGTRWGIYVTGANKNYLADSLGIGTATPTEKLHVSGNILASGTITANSDRRLKKNIKIIKGALSKVLQLEGITFNRKNSEDNQRETGLIAQNVLAVMPEAVRGSEDKMYSVAYGNLVGLLVESIKELKAEVDELRRVS